MSDKVKVYFSKTVLIAVFLLVSTGCAGSSRYMRKVPLDRASYPPEQGKALIIFMRPSSLGWAIQSSVFDVSSDGNDKLVGIVPAKKKVAYMAQPGENFFMIVGENADFMRANLEAGKTYYVLVSPRMGAWKARFSLKPIRKETLNSKKFSAWEKSCQYVENTEASHKWAKDHWASTQSKKKSYLEKWNKKSEKDKNAATLFVQDSI